MSLKQVLAAAALAAAIATPAAAQLAEAVAAIVNDEVISTYDVRQRATLLLASSNIENNADNMQRASAQALRDLVDEHLQLQEARHFEINVTNEQIESTLNDIARSNNTTGPELLRQLASSGINPNTLRDQIRADIAWRRLISGLYGSRVRISDAEVRDTLARIAQGAQHAQFLVSEIFLPAQSEQEFTDMQAGAQRLLQEMQRGAPFPLVARQFSAAPTAASGGDLGWVDSGELRPEVQAVIDRLQPGQVSNPIRTPTGVYLVALREKREGRPVDTTIRVGLRQVSVPIAQRGNLDRARARVTSCQSLNDVVGSITGVEVTDLGQTAESDLSDTVKQQIQGVGSGQATGVTEAGDRAAMLVVCSRDAQTEGLPSHDEIESRLFEQELALLSQRYLRDLRREATIITR